MESNSVPRPWLQVTTRQRLVSLVFCAMHHLPSSSEHGKVLQLTDSGIYRGPLNGGVRINRISLWRLGAPQRHTRSPQVANTLVTHFMVYLVFLKKYHQSRSADGWR